MVVQQPNLSPESTPWAREITQAQRDLRREVDRNSQDNSNNNSQLTSSVNLLTSQVNDLVGRVSYAVSSNSVASWSTNAGVVSFGSPVVFTLTEPRVVSLTYSLRSNIGAAASASGGSSSASVQTNISVNGANDLARGYGYASSATSFAGNGLSSFSTNITVMARALVTLPAGTHTVQGTIDRQATSIGSASSSGSVYDPALFVDVLQLA